MHYLSVQPHLCRMENWNMALLSFDDDSGTAPKKHREACRDKNNPGTHNYGAHADMPMWFLVKFRLLFFNSFLWTNELQQVLLSALPAYLLNGLAQSEVLNHNPHPRFVMIFLLQAPSFHMSLAGFWPQLQAIIWKELFDQNSTWSRLFV